MINLNLYFYFIFIMYKIKIDLIYKIFINKYIKKIVISIFLYLPYN